MPHRCVLPLQLASCDCLCGLQPLLCACLCRPLLWALHSAQPCACPLRSPQPTPAFPFPHLPQTPPPGQVLPAPAVQRPGPAGDQRGAAPRSEERKPGEHRSLPDLPWGNTFVIATVLPRYRAAWPQPATGRVQAWWLCMTRSERSHQLQLSPPAAQSIAAKSNEQSVYDRSPPAHLK